MARATSSFEVLRAASSSLTREEKDRDAVFSALENQCFRYAKEKIDHLHGKVYSVNREILFLNNKADEMSQKSFKKIKNKIIDFYNSIDNSHLVWPYKTIEDFALSMLHKLVIGGKDNLLIKAFLEFTPLDINPLDREGKTPFFYLVINLENSLRNLDRDGFRKSLDLMYIFISHNSFFQRVNHFPFPEYRLSEDIQRIAASSYTLKIAGARGELFKFVSDMEERSIAANKGRPGVALPARDDERSSDGGYDRILSRVGSEALRLGVISEASEDEDFFIARNANEASHGNFGSAEDDGAYQRLGIVEAESSAAKDLYAALPLRDGSQDSLVRVEGKDFLVRPQTRAASRSTLMATSGVASQTSIFARNSEDFLEEEFVADHRRNSDVGDYLREELLPMMPKFTEGSSERSGRDEHLMPSGRASIAVPQRGHIASRLPQAASGVAFARRSSGAAERVAGNTHHSRGTEV